jgi:hypothetical protein
MGMNRVIFLWGGLIESSAGPEKVVDVRQRSEKMARDMDLGDALATVREKRIRTKIYPHVTTRKTLIGRNVICGAPKSACSTKIFLWRIG